MGFSLSSINPTGLDNQDPYEMCDIAHFSCGDWGVLLDLAVHYGWEPAGTEKPIVYDWDEAKLGAWDGDYCTNNTQVVTSEDAANLADALECAVLDNSNHEESLENDPFSNPFLENQAMKSWYKDNKRIIRFIKFCRKGAFIIS